MQKKVLPFLNYQDQYLRVRTWPLKNLKKLGGSRGLGISSVVLGSPQSETLFRKTKQLAYLTREARLVRIIQARVLG